MQTAMDVDQSRDTEIERLRSSVNQAERLIPRLRQERDSVKRDFEFYQLEMKFKVEALQKELQDMKANSNSSNQPSKSSHSTSLHTYRRAAFVSSLVIHQLQGELRTQAAELQSTGEALVSVEWKLQQREGRMRSKDATLETLQQDNETLQQDNATLQQQLDTVEEELSTRNTQVQDLTARIAALEQETRKERKSHEDIGSSLATAEAELSDVSRNLADVESARDSLALQVTHLEQDLEKTQAELHHAESRYSELQTKQLSTMSSTGVVRTLREQIGELEGRILRRTEQIGLHQHDIKRLEANLRLQDERVTEMTSELEVAEREREAMIEDCRSTREGRDEALKRCEDLEESLEVMESRVEQVEQQRDIEVRSLVDVIMKGIYTRRTASRALLSSLSRHVEESSQLRSRLHEVDSSGSKTDTEIKRLQGIVEEKTHALQVLESEREKALADARAASHTLQAAHVNSQEATSRFDDLRDENSSLQKELVQLRHDLESKGEELFTLQQQYESWKLQDAERKSEDRARFESRIDELEEQCSALRETHEELQRRHVDTEEELQKTKEDLERNLSSSSQRDSVEGDLRRNFNSLQHKYDEEVKQLRDQLEIAQANLEGAQHEQVDLESSHQEALEEITRAKEAIEAQLKSANAKLDATLQAEGELGALRSQYEEQVKDLEERLELASTDVDKISDERDQLQQSHDQSSQKLRDVEFQLSELRSRYDSEVQELRDRLAKTSGDLELASQGQSEQTATLQATVQRLQEVATTSAQEKAALDTELASLREQHADLDVKLSTLSGERDSLLKEYGELKISHEQALRDLLNSKTDGDSRLIELTQEIEQLRNDLKSQAETSLRLEEERAQAIEQNEQTIQAQREMAEQLEGLNTQLQQSSALLQQSKRFEEQLQERMTELEAEVQKSLSLQRHQDSQIQERDRELAGLREQLGHAQNTLQQSELTTKAKEIKFTFQISQDEQTIAGLRREINSLRGNGALQETITELREKNEEMEQLLRAKCLEIEENDDRFIELIKEKKKLNSKIESLNRKVTSLQTKLAAGPGSPNPLSMSAPAPAPTSVPVPPPSHAAPAPSLSSSLRASSSKAPPPVATHNSSTPSGSRSRTTSGPSIFSRSKTPEPKIPPPPVFRPRTPETKQLPAMLTQPTTPPATIPPSSSSSSGKKRRAPDDFDDCEGLPAQIFTSDSIPSGDNAFTPRVRRALNNVRTGFTPVRGSTLGGRPHPSEPSPRRTTANPALIADVTNSPRGRKHSDNPADKASKRTGWLGKMRSGQGSRSTRQQNQTGPAR